MNLLNNCVFSVLVGAPKGNSTYKPDVDSPGVLYECSFASKDCAEHAVNSLISGRYFNTIVFVQN